MKAICIVLMLFSLYTIITLSMQHNEKLIEEVITSKDDPFKDSFIKRFTFLVIMTDAFIGLILGACILWTLL